MKGININCLGQDFCRLILDGEKTIETRNSRSLDPYIWQRVGLIQTGRGPARLVGLVTIGDPIQYESEEEWDQDISRHRVYGGEYGWRYGIKYGYPMINPRRISPKLVTSLGVVAREI